MKNFAYYIGVFVITAIMFAFPILATLSFCLNWGTSLTCLLLAFTAVDFIIVTLAIMRCVEDLSDN